MPGQIEDLTDLLAEDWKSLGSVREMGLDTAKFFRQELEKTWGSKHLTVLDETKARNWVMGVGVLVYEFSLKVTLRVCFLIIHPRVCTYPHPLCYLFYRLYNSCGFLLIWSPEPIAYGKRHFNVSP